MRLAAVLALCLASLPAAALNPDLSRLDELPLHALPAQAVAKLVDDAKHRPRQFAIGVPVALDLGDGRWDRVDAQTARWRTRLFSAGAETLNLELAGLALPSGAALWLYDAGAEVVQGPYTSAEVSDGRLWTALVPGETAVLELRVPVTAQPQVRLALAQANHGFRGFGKAGSQAKAGACNVDVVCPLGDAWRNEIRSVARITIGGTLLCSGQLLNNARQDDRMLFLTANHCEIGTAGRPASSVVFYWNFQASVCGGSRNGSLTSSTTGATELADDFTTDFSLLALTQSPAAFNVYLSGWNASPTQVPGSGVSIHHPRGDEKAIARYNGATRTTQQVEVGGPQIPSWRVIWSEGTTEQGSSGAGLWNQNRQVIGHLSGGEAACSGSVDNDQPDYFGRMDAAWLAQGASNHQLKAHLDPANAGICALCGKNPGASACSVANADCPGGGTTGGTGGAGGGGGGGGMPLGVLALLAALIGIRRRASRAGSRG